MRAASLGVRGAGPIAWGSGSYGTPEGLVSALSAGVVTITATSERTVGSSTLTVTAVPDSVDRIDVVSSVGSLIVGGRVQLFATLKDVTGKVLTGGREVIWSATGVSGGSVATVSATGMVTATAPGTVLVEAFCEGQHGAVTIIIADDLDPTIVVSFAGPVVNELVGDTLHVVVGVKSARPLASVTASVGAVRTPLVFRSVGALGVAPLWVGILDVTDLRTGAYQVLAVATDATGARGAGSRQFQRDTRTGKGGSGDQPKQK